MRFDHILVIGFGAPRGQEEIQPFLEDVTRDLSIPNARLREVAHHYEAIGGFSPYNAHTQKLLEALTLRLRQAGVDIPVFLGMRHWHPFLIDVIREICQQGFKRGLGVILAPHRSFASFEKYVQALEDARGRILAAALTYDYLGPWHDHPLFIQAQADRIREVFVRMGPHADFSHLVFSAHSIPLGMAKQSAYAQDSRRSSEEVAKVLRHPNWSLAYQSRSGRPDEPWLEPDVGSVIHKLAAEGVRDLVFVPIGFLCDHAEVLYDLDIEAKQKVQQQGLNYWRASTVMDHPLFVDMLTQGIRNKVNGKVAVSL